MATDATSGACSKSVIQNFHPGGQEPSPRDGYANATLGSLLILKALIEKLG